MSISPEDLEILKLNITDGSEHFHVAPIISSYNKYIHPLVNAVDMLLKYNIIVQEPIKLPTIMVVGDRCSGKSSVIESLARISLPTGPKICTRVPLIIRLQNHTDSEPIIFLEYNKKNVHTDEKSVAEAIKAATEDITGSKDKKVSDKPITLVVKKMGLPDQTIVDLPGIIRESSHGQEKLTEYIWNMIKGYISSEESILLNVFPADIGISSCQCISMSRIADPTGNRILAVITMVDQFPESMSAKTVEMDVEKLPYVCVRNRCAGESFETAQRIEANLFKNTPDLKNIEGSRVGIYALADELAKVQIKMIGKYLPDIGYKIKDAISSNEDKLSELTYDLKISEAMKTLMRIIGLVKESFKRITLQGDFHEYPDMKKMHCTSTMVEIMDDYFSELQAEKEIENGHGNFLRNEIEALKDTKTLGFGLPEYLPREAFYALLKKKVKAISEKSYEVVGKTWDLIESALMVILEKHEEGHPLFTGPACRAAGDLMRKKKQRSTEWIKETLEMEIFTAYTCDTEYMTKWETLKEFEKQLKDGIAAGYDSVNLEAIGKVYIHHLKNVKNVGAAFQLKAKMDPYWDIVLKRLVDSIALHLRFDIGQVYATELENAIMDEIVGSDERETNLKMVLEESPIISLKRDAANNKILLLKNAKKLVDGMNEQLLMESGV